MALKIRRGTEAERTAGGGVVFAEGEIVYVTDTGALYVGDGTTPGGILVGDANLGLISAYLGADILDQQLDLYADLNLNGKDIVGTGNININGNITATGNIDIGDNGGDTVTITAQVDSDITPTQDSQFELGKSNKRWKNIYASGLAVDGQIDAISINANTVADNSTVMVNVASNTFTGNLTGNVTGDLDGNVEGNVSGNVTGNLTGNVEGDVVGSVFADDSTTLVDAVAGVLRGDHYGSLFGGVRALNNGFTILNPGTDGTDASLVASVLGNVTGNVNGNVTGNVTGDLDGNVTGNVVGNVEGDVVGSVFADNSTLLVDAVNGIIPGSVISGTISANLNGTVTGNIFTSVIDSSDSSAITITPSLICNSDVKVDNTLRIGIDFSNGETIITKDNITVSSIGIPTQPLEVRSQFTNFTRAVEVFGELASRQGLVVSALDSEGNKGYLAVQTFNGDINNPTEVNDPAFYDLYAGVESTKATFNVPIKFPVYADSTARDAAIPVPETGMVIVQGTALYFYNGTSWVTVTTS